jgi:hypothetical protein
MVTQSRAGAEYRQGGVIMVEQIKEAGRWCILRTSGPRTLALARSLREAGTAAWTPTGIARRIDRHRRTIEREYPIAPTFVFAPAGDAVLLAYAAVDPLSVHPSFSMFRHADRIPLIGEAEIDGLRLAEELAMAELAAARDAEDREARRIARAVRQRTDKARRKALRSVRRDLKPGTRVEVVDYPAMAGMQGEVVSSRGKEAVVTFGGSLVMTIEAWQLLPDDVAMSSLVSPDRASAAS